MGFLLLLLLCGADSAEATDDNLRQVNSRVHAKLISMDLSGCPVERMLWCNHGRVLQANLTNWGCLISSDSIAEPVQHRHPRCRGVRDAACAATMLRTDRQDPKYVLLLGHSLPHCA